MAEPLGPGGEPAVVDPEPAESALEAAYRPPSTSYRRRFRAAYIALAVAFWGVAAGIAVSVTGGFTRDEGPAWSTWKPNADGLEGAREIAARVGAAYHLTGGRQLVAVQAHDHGSLELIAVRRAAGSNDYATAPADHSYVYLLCGLGNQCAINVGKPSEARARLLRREALELALYTFKYIKGVDSVVTFLPPPPNLKPPRWSVYFRKSDFKEQLKHPLRTTLSDAETPTPTTLKPTESDTIERLTRPRWFKSEIQQLQDGAAVLVLEPLTTSS